jgi:hypothetical protein
MSEWIVKKSFGSWKMLGYGRRFFISYNELVFIVFVCLNRTRSFANILNTACSVDLRQAT